MIAQRTTLISLSTALIAINIGVHGAPSVKLPATELMVSYQFAQAILGAIVLTNAVSYCWRFWNERQLDITAKLNEFDVHINKSMSAVENKNNAFDKMALTEEERKKHYDFNQAYQARINELMSLYSNREYKRKLIFDLGLPAFLAVISIGTIFT